MKAINLKNITHIEFFDAKEGILLNNGYWATVMKYVPYRKKSFFLGECLEGYHENGVGDSLWNGYRSFDWVTKNSHKVYIVSGCLWTYPRIVFYSGKDIIATKYFFQFDDMIELVNTLNYENIKD